MLVTKAQTTSFLVQPFLGPALAQPFLGPALASDIQQPPADQSGSPNF